MTDAKPTPDIDKMISELWASGSILAHDAAQEITRLRQLAELRDEMLEAVRLTIAENGNLADGDDCTLRHLVAAIARAEGGAS